MSAVFARCIRRFLYTLSRVEISVYAVYPDTCGRSYPYIFVYADVTVSENYRRLSFLCKAHALLTNPFEMSGYESDTCGQSYTIRIRYVWTQIFLYPHKKTCGYKNLRIRVDGASAGIKFCHVNVSRRSNPLSRGRVRSTSNSRKIRFGGGFASLSKVTIKATALKVVATTASEWRRALISKTRGLPAFFLFSCLATIQ